MAKSVVFRRYGFFAAVRLWSTKLNANLVSYKGHNYPVWDVQVRNQLWSFHLWNKFIAIAEDEN